MAAYSSEGLSGLISLEASGHLAAIWSYVANTLAADPQLMSTTEEGSEFSTKLMALLLNVDMQENLGLMKSHVAAVSDDGEAEVKMTVIPAFIIQLVMTKLVEYIINNVTNDEAWETAVAFIREIISRMNK